MTDDTTTTESLQPLAETPSDSAELFDSWIDPLESAIRERVRGLIEELIHSELDALLARPRYGRRAKDSDDGAAMAGYRHGIRTRTLMGTFGQAEIAVPRARLQTADGRPLSGKARPFVRISAARLRRMW